MTDLTDITNEADAELRDLEKKEYLESAKRFGIGQGFANFSYALEKKTTDLIIGAGYVFGPILKYGGLIGLTISLTEKYPKHMGEFFYSFIGGSAFLGLAKLLKKQRENERLMALFIKYKNKINNLEKELCNLKLI